MNRDAEVATVFVPGVVSISASSRRTLKFDETFAMFDDFGDALELERDPSGLFHRDTRFLSRLIFSIEGHRPLLLGSTVQPDNLLLDVDLTNPDIYRGAELLLAKDTFHLSRAKFLFGNCCYELFTVTSFAERRTRLRLSLEFDADFADLFEIRGHVRARRGEVSRAVATPAEVRFDYGSLDAVPRSTRLCFSPRPTRLTTGRADFELDLRARERRALGVTIQCLNGEAAAPPEPRFFTAIRRARRSRALRLRGAELETSNASINGVLSRSLADLAILATETPHGLYPYAGVPWFSTVFGRDGIVTAIETLWLDPSIARGVLRFLAAHQGDAERPEADEEPGKILHELREGELARLGEVPFGRYYGSVDSTPLFIVLDGLYWERTRDRETLGHIWPAVKAALEWMRRYGDRDGDGFIEYARRRDSGLRNQGWKDSEDSVMHADGRLAEGPIALCEVQGYAELAYRLAAGLAEDLGEPALAGPLRQSAQELARRIDEAFWCEDLGTYALALDGAKDRCRVHSSNAGHLLFCGSARPERAARVAQGLLGRESFTGWGIRTLGAREKRFNPTSYHNGSIWPHDNALLGLGFARYGLSAEALKVTGAIFESAAHMHLRRLPELFCGFDRKRDKAPTPYPVACAPQAWAASAPLALLQACLGMEIHARARTVVLRRPRLPAFLDWLRVRNLQVADARLDILFRREEDSVAVSLLERKGEAEVEVQL